MTHLPNVHYADYIIDSIKNAIVTGSYPPQILRSSFQFDTTCGSGFGTKLVDLRNDLLSLLKRQAHHVLFRLRANNDPIAQAFPPFNRRFFTSSQSSFSSSFRLSAIKRSMRSSTVSGSPLSTAMSIWTSCFL